MDGIACRGWPCSRLASAQAAIGQIHTALIQIIIAGSGGVMLLRRAGCCSEWMAGTFRRRRSMTILDNRNVTVPAGTVSLKGILAIPVGASGLVAFAHGSGSSRFSPRNRGVAQALNGTGFATLLLDLLTTAENERDALTAEFRFDIPLLARRLTFALKWLASQPATCSLPVGLFGASTGAAAVQRRAGDVDRDELLPDRLAATRGGVHPWVCLRAQPAVL